jgi:hypothetical protein
MSLRQILIENNISPKNIALAIRDSSSDEDEEIVELIAN